MNLKEWLWEKRITQTKAAKDLHMTREYLRLIMRGDRFPTPTRAKEIIAYTGGAVTYEEIYKDKIECRCPLCGKRMGKEISDKVKGLCLSKN